MIGIYHSRDLDGFASGAIIKRKYPEAKLIGYDYGQSIDLPEWHPEPIVMADVSMPMDKMVEIARLCNWQFTWIDHHKSAIKEYNDFTANGESFCKAVLQDGISAAEIAWKYFFPEEEMPEGILLLGEYDTWRNQDADRWENRIMPYQFGMRSICSSPETFPWDLVVGMFDVAGTEEIIQKGKTILEYQRAQDERACKSSFEAPFEGLRAICLNAGGVSSQTFKSVYDESKHDLMMPFFFNGSFWTVSLYTTKDIDCSEIAKRKGGGGHRKAAGFQVQNITEIFK